MAHPPLAAQANVPAITIVQPILTQPLARLLVASTGYSAGFLLTAAVPSSYPHGASGAAFPAHTA